jgi:hypothetical protein
MPSAPTVWTLDDNILTWVAESHKLAKLRGEQHAKLLTMEDYATLVTPSSSAISLPANNATNIPLTQLLKWANSPGADAYHLQLGTDSLFASPVVNDSTIDRTSKSVTLNSGTNYFARVRAKNTAGTSTWSPICTFTTGTTDVTELPVGNLPKSFELYQNYPNPFNPTTTIRYQIPNVGTQPSTQMAGKYIVSLRMYNLLGQEIATLVNEARSAGRYEARFDASNLASGIYFYRLSAGSFTITKAMLLLK